MPQLLGEYECKIDSKGRMRLPSSLMEQLGAEGTQAFVVNRGMEKCLTLYPKEVWDVIIARVNKLNTYKKKNREFMRFIYRGATEISPDSSDRILLTKRLTEYANIKKEIVLSAVNDRIEIWAKEQYDLLISEEPEDFAQLAEEVMGHIDMEELSLPKSNDETKQD